MKTLIEAVQVTPFISMVLFLVIGLIIGIIPYVVTKSDDWLS